MGYCCKGIFLVLPDNRMLILVIMYTGRAKVMKN